MNRFILANRIRLLSFVVFAMTMAAWTPLRAQRLSPQTEPVLRAYRVQPAKLPTLVNDLKKQFSHDAKVRIAGDARTSQLIVSAPLEIQGQIARRLDRPSANTTRKVALKNITRDQLAGALHRATSGRIRATNVRDNANTTLTLQGRNGQQAQVEVDGRKRMATIRGPSTLVTSVEKFIDRFQTPFVGETRFLPLTYARAANMRSAINMMLAGADAKSRVEKPRPASNRLAVAMFQPRNDDDDEDDGPADGGPEKPVDDKPAEPAADEKSSGLIGPVDVELLDGLDVIVVRGHKRDVARVLKIIEDIEKLSADTTPATRVLSLKHAGSEAITEVAQPLYDEVFAPRHGRAIITPLLQPNALLLVGRDDAVKAAAELVEKLDQPTKPANEFRVFRLRHISSADAEQTINQFYDERPGLGVRARITSEFRTNSLIVQASPRDMAEVAALIQKLDVSKSASKNEMKVFHLKNTLAEELAEVLQEAIVGETTSRSGATGSAAGGNRARNVQARSAMLTLATLDPDGRKLLTSGILADVRITGDARANALIVTAPAESMGLISALIAQLDQLPGAETQIKVFTITSGDAVSLVEMLDELLGAEQAAGQPGLQSAAGAGESSLVPLRFSVDERTNSIIASGSAGDLKVVEAILLRLDQSDVDERVTTVYRLRYAPALDVSNAINEFLRSERQVQDLAPETVSPFEQIEREVVVVPETVSNTLIVSATPKYYKEITKLVEDLDRRPPMVMIQVLIAEVALDNTRELGVELGIQDSLLYDRGVIDAMTGTLEPGFNFNNQPLGNSSSAQSQATRDTVGRQVLSNFAVMRSNSQLGYGGLVLSAGSDSLNVLIRALEDERRLQILSRPQVMTLDNQPAFVQVGQRVPRITTSQITTTGTINNTVLENVGILVGVTPRISPDGLIAMEIDAEKSELAPEEDGVPISINANGDVVRSPIINIATAQTTVSARSGQTVVLGGLITKNDQTVTRAVPWISDIPVLGHAFRYDSESVRRTEFLIIMTPYIVDSDEDVETINQVESARMSWCLGDVVDIDGDRGLRSACDNWGTGNVPLIFPDENPTGETVDPVPDDLPAPDLPMNEQSSSRRDQPPVLVPTNATRITKPSDTETSVIRTNFHRPIAPQSMRSVHASTSGIHRLPPVPR